MALMASDIKLADPLKDPLSGIATRSRGRLQDILGQRQASLRQGQIVSGRPMGEYTGTTMSNAYDMGGRNIDDSLYGVLGGASLKDYQSQQDYDRQMQLAREIGDLTKPSALQEIMGGLSGAGQSAGSFKSLYDQYSNRPNLRSSQPSYGSSLYTGSASRNPYGMNMGGYDTYDYKTNWGGY